MSCRGSLTDSVDRQRDLSLSGSSDSPSLTPAERLTRADDLMSDVLDCCLWPSKSSSQLKRTIKFTPGYRRPRGLNMNDVKKIIACVQHGKLRNLTEATTLIRQLPAVGAYVANAEPPRLLKHIGLYLQLFQNKCGIKFCETDRYDQSRVSKKAFPNSAPPPPIPLSLSAAGDPIPKKVKPSRSQKELRELYQSVDLSRCSISLRQTRSGNLPNSHNESNLTSTNKSHSSQRIHLAVFATKDYYVNDIVVGCEGSFADLTEQEDMKLRGNTDVPVHPRSNGIDHPAKQARRRSHPSRTHHHEDHFDFSHLVNSRGKFQVFCGPARFVNHDCQNNVELLREGFTIKFKVVRNIKANEEILTSYGANYFGEGNCECMCATCENEGKGFYAGRPSSSTLAEPDPTTRENSIKPDPEEIAIPPVISTDTELTSLMDSSETPESRSSGTPALDGSPVIPPSLSLSPLNPRRSGLASVLQFSRQSRRHLEQSDSACSRSSSLRRNQPRMVSIAEPSSLNRRSDVIPVSFLPTADLTLPLFSLGSLNALVRESKLYGWLDSPLATRDDSPVIREKAPPVQVVPVKRKTYWITTKQKELGLLPWEINPPIPATQAGDPSQSNLTSDFDGPSSGRKRHSTCGQGSSRYPTLSSAANNTNTASTTASHATLRRRASCGSNEKETKLPARSYWVSTKQKQSGILPWEKVVNSEASSESQLVSSNRSTRASQKAIEGVKKPMIGFPSAPRGQKLSYKIFEEGTEEAELLNTAIGRELLGFRPNSRRSKVKERGALVGKEGEDEACSGDTGNVPCENVKGDENEGRRKRMKMSGGDSEVKESGAALAEERRDRVSINTAEEIKQSAKRRVDSSADLGDGETEEEDQIDMLEDDEEDDELQSDAGPSQRRVMSHEKVFWKNQLGWSSSDGLNETIEHQAMMRSNSASNSSTTPTNGVVVGSREQFLVPSIG